MRFFSRTSANQLFEEVQAVFSSPDDQAPAHNATETKPRPEAATPLAIKPGRDAAVSRWERTVNVFGVELSGDEWLTFLIVYNGATVAMLMLVLPLGVGMLFAESMLIFRCRWLGDAEE